MVLLAAALAAMAYYLGKMSAQAGLQARASRRRLKGEVPGEEEAKQDEDTREPLLSVVASDDEDEDIKCRSEDGHRSWSVVDGLRAPSLAATCAVLIQGPVTYLRERDQPRYQPPREGLREAQVTAERLGDG